MMSFAVLCKTESIYYVNFQGGFRKGGSRSYSLNREPSPDGPRMAGGGGGGGGAGSFSQQLNSIINASTQVSCRVS